MIHNQKIQQDKLHSNSALPVRTKAEVNFLILPYFSLDKNANVNRRIEFKEMQQRGNETYEIVWTVIPHPDFGLPRDFERRLQRAVEHSLSFMPRPISNPVPLPSFRELARLMGVRCSGQFVEKVKNGFAAMMMTGIMSKRSYYNKSKRAWMEEGFHLYDKIVFKGEQISDGCFAEHNHAYFTGAYLDNLNALYVRPIDFAYLKSLRPVASRLYEILGVKFYGHRDFIQYKYSTLCRLLPLTQQKTLARARQQLDVSHEDLKQTCFLRCYAWSPIQRVNDDWYIRYEPGERFFREIETLDVASPVSYGDTYSNPLPEIQTPTVELHSSPDDVYKSRQGDNPSGNDSLWPVFSGVVKKYPDFDLRHQDREWFQQRVQSDTAWNPLNLMEEIQNWGDWLDIEHRKKSRQERNKFPQSNFKGSLISWLKHSLKSVVKGEDQCLETSEHGRKGWDLPSDYPIDIM